MTAIETRGVTRRYRQGEKTVTALEDVDLAVEGGEFVSVMGPSGSGKTTLLNILGLLDGPTAGTVLLDGQDVTDLSDRERTDRRKETIGFVFQHYYLLPTLTALENVKVPRFFEADAADDRAADLLERVGLGDRLDHRPSELSGGQKQRVAIARSLINEPRVLLADEPTGNLDRETSVRILKEFESVSASDFAVVTVTHDDLVAEYTDRTINLVDGVRET